MSKNRLLKSQANEIFLLLQQAGLPLSEFKWIDRDTQNPRLVHEPSGHYFKLNFAVLPHFVDIAFSPSDYQYEETSSAYNWNIAKSNAEKWVGYLQRELREPDFWQTIAGEKTLIDGIHSAEAEDLPFSQVDQDRIRKSLDEIKIFVASTQELTNDQLRIIRERLDYLADASSRMGRKDWLMTATGVFTSIIVAAAVTPTTAHEFLRFAGTALAWILEHRSLLIP
jgi:hypothetical protein